MLHCSLSSTNVEFDANLTMLFDQGCSCKDIATSSGGILFKCADMDPPMPSPFKCVFFCLFGLVATLSILANSIVMWIILRHPVMHQRATNRHVLNLAFSDICLTLFNTVPIGIANVLDYWPFPAWSCPILHMIGVVPFCVSVFTMVLISLDRYYAILYPLHRRPWGDPESKTFTLLGLATVWVLAIIFALPEYFIIYPYENVLIIHVDNFDGKRKLQSVGTFCEPDLHNLPYKLYNWTMLMLQFVLPILVLAFAYGRIACELYSSKNAPENSVKDSILNAKRRTAKLFAMLVFSFLALWLPYELMFTVPNDILVNSGWHLGFKVILNLAFLLAMSSTVVSPIIYYNMSERYRTGFCHALSWVPFWHGGGITEAQYRDIFALNGCPRLSRVLFAASNDLSSIKQHHAKENQF